MLESYEKTAGGIKSSLKPWKKKTIEIKIAFGFPRSECTRYNNGLPNEALIFEIIKKKKIRTRHNIFGHVMDCARFSAVAVFESNKYAGPLVVRCYKK